MDLGIVTILVRKKHQQREERCFPVYHFQEWKKLKMVQVHYVSSQFYVLMIIVQILGTSGMKEEFHLIVERNPLKCLPT